MLHPLLHFLHPSFLQLQVCDDGLKSGLWQQSQIRSGVTEILIKAGSESAKHELIGDFCANITKFIGEHLEAHAIVINGGVILVAPKKFLLQEYKVLKLVVGEERVDLGPHDASIVVLGDDRVEDVLRDGLVEPSDERGLNGGPLRIALHVLAVHRAIDVLDEIVLAEDKVEVGLSRVVR